MTPAESECGITGSYIESRMDYDPVEGKFFRKRRRDGRSFISNEIGYLRPDGYVQVKIKHRYYLAHRLAWLWMTGSWPDGEIDHVNRDKADNRFKNLRGATRSQNCVNIGIQKNNKSGCSGVFLQKEEGKTPRWRAWVTVQRKVIHLGGFLTREEAISARKKGEAMYYGEFAGGA